MARLHTLHHENHHQRTDQQKQKWAYRNEQFACGGKHCIGNRNPNGKPGAGL